MQFDNRTVAVAVALASANIRDFKVRRLRTTTTVKHAIAHDQNHVTVHFFTGEKCLTGRRATT